MRFPCCVLLGVLAICSFLPAQTNPVPFVNNPLVPETAAPGAAAFQLTVNGTGFVSGSVVNWNGSPRATTFISASQLQAAILSSDLAAAGTSYVTVSSPAPGGGKSNIAIFNVALPSPSVGFNSLVTNETKNCDKTVLQPQIVADFNGDGKPDVAGTVCDGGYIFVSLSNGNGTFQSPIYTALLPSPGTMIAADFNGDGKMDLATINDENNVAVLLGNGDGTFQTAKNFLTGVQPYYLAAADMNGDGKLDLITAASTDNAVDVLLGNGDGTFQPYIASPTGGVDPGALVIGDFNGDGKLDVAVSENSSYQVTIMFGNGDGTLTFSTDYFASFGVAAAMDMNGDGILDLVGLGTPLSGGNTGIGIMYGNPGGTFQDPVYVSVPTIEFQYYSYLFGIADLNGDGKLDFWTLGNAGDNLGTSIFSILGNGDGTWQSPVLYSTTPAGYSTGGMVEADFNNDGKPDFLLANSCLGVSCIDVFLQTPVVVTPDTLAFGTKLIKGKSKPLPVTLTNAGPAAVSAPTFAFSGSNAADFSQTNNCPSSLASEASCTISVYFVPSTEYYPESATLSITESAPGGTQQVALTGTGTYIRETPGSLNFGSVAVGSSSTQTVTLTNTDTQTLSVGRIYIAQSPFGKEFSVTNNCGNSLAKGAQCQLTVVFAPTATGHAAAKISVNFGDDVPPEIQLSGSGT
ncbi:MAG: FG-GAP-like repeat-containing protein [Candidatus Sulfotelmatobacter sp.]